MHGPSSEPSARRLVGAEAGDVTDHHAAALACPRRTEGQLQVAGEDARYSPKRLSLTRAIPSLPQSTVSRTTTGPSTSSQSTLASTGTWVRTVGVYAAPSRRVLHTQSDRAPTPHSCGRSAAGHSRRHGRPLSLRGGLSPVHRSDREQQLRPGQSAVPDRRALLEDDELSLSGRHGSLNLVVLYPDDRSLAPDDVDGLLVLHRPRI